MYKKIPVREQAPAPDYGGGKQPKTADGQNAKPVPGGGTQAPRSGSPEQTNRTYGAATNAAPSVKPVSSAGAKPEPLAQTRQEAPRLSSAQAAYLDMQQRHTRLSEQIDKKNGRK